MQDEKSLRRDFFEIKYSSPNGGPRLTVVNTLTRKHLHTKTLKHVPHSDLKLFVGFANAARMD